MAAQWKHKRYFRLREASASGMVLYTFTSVADANTKIGFTSVYSTSSPTKTEVLADSGQTLVVTYEFNSESDQTAFKSAIDGVYSGGSIPFNPGTGLDGANDMVEHFKTEWSHQDGSVSSTAELLNNWA